MKKFLWLFALIRLTLECFLEALQLQSFLMTDELSKSSQKSWKSWKHDLGEEWKTKLQQYWILPVSWLNIWYRSCLQIYLKRLPTSHRNSQHLYHFARFTLSSPLNYASRKHCIFMASTTLSLLDKNVELDGCAKGHSTMTQGYHVSSAATNPRLRKYCSTKQWDAIEDEVAEVQESRKP